MNIHPYLDSVTRWSDLLRKHQSLAVLPTLDDLEQALMPASLQKHVPILVPDGLSGAQLRTLASDIHQELVGVPLEVEEGVADVLFEPGQTGCRFTIGSDLWNSQSGINATFAQAGVVTHLNLFAAVCYLLELCTAQTRAEAVMHPMWSRTVSKQVAILCRGKTVYIRARPSAENDPKKLGGLVVSTGFCRNSIAPVWLNDYAVRAR